MKITIHRGTDEIGGSCVQIAAGGRNVFIDAGLPLDSNPAHPPTCMTEADALFISHCHPDHYGLLDQIPKAIPVYMSELGRSFIEASAIFCNKTLAVEGTTSSLRSRQSVYFGNLTVTPWLMDHSAPDAFGFLARYGDKAVFYTGDFRAHGRKSYAYDYLLTNLPPKITAMIIEGTLLERSNASYPSEFCVESGMVEVFKEESSLCYVISSSQNIDRLVSVFRASRRSGRELVVDIYTAWIMELVSRFHKSTPRIGWGGVRVLAHGPSASRHYGIVKANPRYFGDFCKQLYEHGVALREADLAQNPGKYVLKTNRPLSFINKFEFPSASVVYSLWGGYLRPEFNARQAIEYSELSTRNDVKFAHIHTSGHADLSTLKELVNTCKPKVLIPIHTEHKDKFPQHFDNVLVLDDGVCVTV